MGISHSWNGTVLTITSDSGTSSADLKGDIGIRGPQGPQGPQGEIDTNLVYTTKNPPSAEEVGARPADWMPTAEEVGARPNTWMPTAEEVGATSAGHANDGNNPHGVTAEQVGARPNTWMPTAEDVGAAPAIESTDFPGCYYRTVNGNIEWVNPPFELGVEYRTAERWDGKSVFTKLLDLGSLPANSTATYSGLLTTSTKVNSMELIAYTSDYQQIPLAYHSGITSVIYNRAAGNIIIKTNTTFSNISNVYLKVKYTDYR